MIRNLFCALVFTILASILSTTNGERNDSTGMHTLSDPCGNVTATIKHVTIPVGWPFRLGCKPPLDFRFVNPSSPSPPPTTCVIMNENEVVFNDTIQAIGWSSSSYSEFQYQVSSVKAEQNGSIYTSYEIRKSTCEVISYVLTVEESHQRSMSTCQNATFYTIDSIELYEGRPRYIECFTQGAPFYLKNETYQVNWYKDCQLVKTVEKQGKTVPNSFSSSVDRYQIANANFTSSFMGEFSCSVTYKGFEMFLTKLKTCVKYESSGIPSIHHITSPEIKANAGHDVVLTCGGLGAPGIFLLSVIEWFRYFNGTEKSICANHVAPFASSRQPDDSLVGKYECDVLSNAIEADKCFTRAQDVLEDEHKGIYIVNSSLVIRNFADSDVGKYTCRQYTAWGTTEASFEISLITWTPLIIILPSVLGFILLVLLVVMVVICVKKRTRKLRKHKIERLSSVNSDMKSALA